VTSVIRALSGLTPGGNRDVQSALLEIDLAEDEDLGGGTFDRLLGVQRQSDPDFHDQSRLGGVSRRSLTDIQSALENPEIRSSGVLDENLTSVEESSRGVFRHENLTSVEEPSRGGFRQNLTDLQSALENPNPEIRSFGRRDGLLSSVEESPHLIGFDERKMLHGEERIYLIALHIPANRLVQLRIRERTIFRLTNILLTTQFVVPI
jgi:hypothetical protein